ncbi:hypothetical protein ACFO1B_50040 [Dactylosporangium siamense]|uniref:Uncharacterized protein n=1 Tax=Dactylosporangium siamense TaxID=685454 RepID=A0A919UIB4_9ACTN|nr:hypothetical protein [Dactylosporangium siamense]GIG52435.1 hypothetical protein Dsi01nite_104760 [Dactylosporangium siamense]
MGYWGTLIAVRGSRTPTALQDLDAAVRTHEGAARGDGWRVYDVPDNVLGRGLDVLLDLVAASSSPVIAAYIADSDYGQVVAASPSGDRWGVWLDRGTAHAFEREHHVMNGMPHAAARRRADETIAAFGCPPAEAVRHAIGWAAEAGYTVQAGAIGQILRTARRPGLAARLSLPGTRYVFAEDAYFGLLDSLGLPRASVSNPARHLDEA